MVIRNPSVVVQPLPGVLHHKQCKTVISHTVSRQCSADRIPDILPGRRDVFEGDRLKDIILSLRESGVSHAVDANKPIKGAGFFCRCKFCSLGELFVSDLAKGMEHLGCHQRQRIYRRGIFSENICWVVNIHFRLCFAAGAETILADLENVLDFHWFERHGNLPCSAEFNKFTSTTKRQIGQLFSELTGLSFLSALCNTPDVSGNYAK